MLYNVNGETVADHGARDDLKIAKNALNIVLAMSEKAAAAFSVAQAVIRGLGEGIMQLPGRRVRSYDRRFRIPF